MPFHCKYLQPINTCNLKDQVKIPLGSFNFVPYFQSVKKSYILTSTANIDGCRKLTAEGGKKAKEDAFLHLRNILAIVQWEFVADFKEIKFNPLYLALNSQLTSTYKPVIPCLVFIFPE